MNYFVRVKQKSVKQDTEGVHIQALFPDGRSMTCTDIPHRSPVIRKQVGVGGEVSGEKNLI